MKSIDARTFVRDTGCSAAANVVTMTFTCASVVAARQLFMAVREAANSGEVSIVLPTGPGERAQS